MKMRSGFNRNIEFKRTTETRGTKLMNTLEKTRHKNHFAGTFLKSPVRAPQRLVNVYQLSLLRKHGLIWTYFTDTNLE